MARPRVFVSSTFYDLRQVHADLERFISQLGYEPVLHERGRVAYGSKKELEEYCYREIDLCDILISIIGGRYGTGSQQQPYSITQSELKRAVERGKAVFIFVESSVHAEYQTFLKNKETQGMVYGFVDNVAVYKFIGDRGVAAQQSHQLVRDRPGDSGFPERAVGRTISTVSGGAKPDEGSRISREHG